jgi:hypothetical protein
MNVRRRLTVAISVAAMVALLAPALTGAALPEPTRALVVPFKSIGPVKFGISKARVVQKWGQPQCAHEDTTGMDTCVWLSESPRSFPPEGTGIQIRNGEVCGMMMRAGTNFRSGELTITRLKDWKTEEGVGLGSKMRRAKRLLGGETVKRKHHVTTAFSPGTTDASRHKLEGIDIFKDGCRVT